MSETIQKRFFTIFSGLQRAHGTYTLSGQTTDKGKKQGNALTKTEPATEELWLKHLNGEYGLGIFPLLDDGTCGVASNPNVFFNLVDSFGDGWNGGFITFGDDVLTIADSALGSGGGAAITVTVYSTKDYGMWFSILRD